MEIIYGKHAVLDALEKRPDTLGAIYASSDYSQDLGGVHPKKIGDVLKRLPKDAVHQNIAAEFYPKRLLIPFKEWNQNFEPTEHTAVAVLGELQDPHNVGAIIRSAAAFGVSAVLIPEHRSASVTGTVVKVSVGTAFTVPLVSVGNVNDALRTLQKDGYWVYGLDMDGDTQLPKEQFTHPSVFVIGNEGKGLREKTRETCDTILSIPMSKDAESLNASVSAAITMYAWKTQR